MKKQLCAVSGLRVLVFALSVAFAAPALAQPQPIIERIEPSSGPPGTQVQIIGRQLGVYSQVLLGSVELPVLRRLPNRWTVQIPDGAQTGSIVIQTPQGGFAGPLFRVTSAQPPPQVVRVTPSAGPPGSDVTLEGDNFSPRLADDFVWLGSLPVVIRAATPTTLRVIVPAGAASGSFRVQVVGAGETLSPPFVVATGTAITDVTPQRGPPGSLVTLTGTGFSSRDRDNRVMLGGSRVRVRSASPTALVVEVPRRATDGPFVVDVRHGGRATSPQPFTVQSTPRVLGFSPPAGAPGMPVVIQGDGFGQDPRYVNVTLAGRPVILRRVVDNRIDVEIPPGAASGPFVVRVHDLEVSSGQSFSVMGALAMGDFTPRSGPPGTLVTLRGQGFSLRANANHVSLSGQPCQLVASSPTQLQFRAPSAASGPIEVSVDGAGSGRTSTPFVVTSPPFIAGFAPTSGPVGTLVTIQGTHFGINPSIVRVELATQPMQVQSVSDTRIVAVVPPSANSGRIAVMVGMEGGAASGTDFRVEARRQVYALEPAYGAPGTEVVIRGQGFPPRGVVVQFSGAVAQRARRMGPAELRVNVPAGAVTGPVTVVLPGGNVMPAGDFSVRSAAPVVTVAPPIPGTLAISAVQARCLRPGCQVVIQGSGFSASAPQNRVSFGGRPARVVSATPNRLTVTIPNIRGQFPFVIDVRNVGTVQTPPLSIP